MLTVIRARARSITVSPSSAHVSPFAVQGEGQSGLINSDFVELERDWLQEMWSHSSEKRRAEHGSYLDLIDLSEASEILTRKVVTLFPQLKRYQ